MVGMGVPLESVAHIIQVALTPVFLMSGIASLMNVFNARLARVADQADALHSRLDLVAGDDEAEVSTEATAIVERLRLLRRQLWVLDVGRGFAALAGVGVCAATFTLFLGGLQDAAVATALFVSFGAAVLCTAGALAGFLVEVLLSWRRHGARWESMT